MTFPLRKGQPYRLGYLFNQPTFYGLKHEGTDLIVPIGVDYLGSFDGTVTFSGWGPLLGYRVEYTNDRWLFKAGHFSQLLCKTRDKIKMGQVLAKSGYTGALRGDVPHIHWAVYDRMTGQRVDPLSLDYSAVVANPLDDLRKSINDVFKEVFGRLPVVKENSYYLARIHPPTGDGTEITTRAQLKNKMLYWKSKGRTMGDTI